MYCSCNHDCNCNGDLQYPVALATKKNSQKRYKKTHQGTRIEIMSLRKLQTTMMLKSSHGSTTVFEANSSKRFQMIGDHGTYLYDTSNGTHAQGACGASVVEWARANVACAMVQGGPTALSCRHDRVRAQGSQCSGYAAVTRWRGAQPRSQ